LRQGFAKHFQILNLEPTKKDNHGRIELKDLDREKVKIPNRFRKQI
jgi:hypothetical protein